MEREINPVQNPNPINPQLLHKHLHPGIWIAILIVAASVVGYLVWANLSQEWPFEENLQPNSQKVLQTPDKPVLTFAAGTNPYVQITWNYDIAESFNIYRSTDPNAVWEKIISSRTSAAHAAVDYNFPKDSAVLYYRIASVDSKGNESSPSEFAEIKLSDETANWETYTNSQDEYSIQYPPNWSVMKIGNVVSIYGHNADLSSINIIYYSGLNVLPLNPITNKPYEYFEQYVTDSHFFTNQKLTSLNSGTAKSGTLVQDPSYKVLLIGGNGHFYEITYKARYNQTLSELDKILSTFKFTN